MILYFDTKMPKMPKRRKKQFRCPYPNCYEYLKWGLMIDHWKAFPRHKFNDRSKYPHLPENVFHLPAAAMHDAFLAAARSEFKAKEDKVAQSHREWAIMLEHQRLAAKSEEERMGGGEGKGGGDAAASMPTLRPTEALLSGSARHACSSPPATFAPTLPARHSAWTRTASPTAWPLPPKQWRGGSAGGGAGV